MNAQVKDPTWRILNPGPGQGAQLRWQTAAQGGRNGRLIFPAIVRDGSSAFYNVSIYSDDAGVTWKRGSLTPVSGPTESDLVELNDGRLLLSARNDGGASVSRYHFISNDGGQTWATLANIGGIRVSRVDTALLSVSSGGTSTVVLSAPLGDLTSSGFSGTSRNNIGLWLSGDQGQTFPRFKHLAYGPGAYSALVTLGNGDLGLLYEATGSTLFTSAWYPPPP